MVNAITAGTTSAYGSAPAASSASLDAQLSTCRAQLEDWVTCPSSKTPEGKEKVKELTTRYAAIKRQIEQVAQTPSRRSTDGVAAAAGQVRQPGRGAVGLLGARLDLYA
ncbi:MAG: hypothetical protein JSR59_08160 [Proteobacteria bacterium]|nr:hypothetical protein [Pseudomonadota bacterium]